MYHDYSMQKIIEDLRSPEKKNLILDTDTYNEIDDPEGKMDIPCYRGSEEYMPNIITPIHSEAAENIARIIKETDGIVYVAAIGCFTNVASALLPDPSIMDKMVVLLVGANSFAHVDCNEFNLMQNRAAARVFFECGVPVVVFLLWAVLKS